MNGERVVDRPRVTVAITERLRRHTLLRVIAPPGAGKTTALRQVVQGLEVPVAWLTVNEWHRSPGQFLDDIVGAFDPIVPGLRERLHRDRALELGPAHAAALLGSVVSHSPLVLVLDDCHVLAGAGEAEGALCALLRHRGAGLRVVLSGRLGPSLAGLGLDGLEPSSLIGEELLHADLEEAREILRRNGSEMDAQAALRATGGWVAGLVFESWRSSDAPASAGDPLTLYLAREVRPALAPEDDRILVASSAFDVVDADRLAALGCDDPAGLLERLRLVGVPATWIGENALKLHPRVRDVLRAELERSPESVRRRVARAAADAYERDGKPERALALYLSSGDLDAVRRLLPDVIVALVERGDLQLADRYLDAVSLDPEPASVVLARLMLASRRQSSTEGRVTLDALGDDRLAELVDEEPVIGSFACNFLAAGTEGARAERVLDRMPAGRAADAARLIMSLARDDPHAPIPEFAGDAVDVVVARALWSRGKFQLLDRASDSVMLAAGVPRLLLTTPGTPSPRDAAHLGIQIARLSRAVEARDEAEANAALAVLEARRAVVWAVLGKAEIAVRLERDPDAALAALGRIPISGIHFFDELAAVWRGAALLLQSDAEVAAAVLGDAVESMHRGDRTLGLPAALVYLAEAEWRLGNEAQADRAADEAYRVAHDGGSMRNLLLALADFPGVASRRLDAEPGGDSPWHTLGRALVVSADRSRSGPLRAGAHLHDLGEPVLVLEGGVVVRTKIKKSLELLAFLLSRPAARATRAEVLTALWDGRDDDSSRAYLRQALRHLRDAIEPSVTIAAEGDSLAVAGAVTADSLSFDALVGAAALEQGERRLGLLLDALDVAGRGSFLDGSRGDAWIDDRRSRFESLVADVRLDAAALMLDLDRHLDALRLIDEALAENPLLERGWRLQMTALAMLGDLDGVVTAYGRCRAALAEIGIEPTATTTELARTLRR